MHQKLLSSTVTLFVAWWLVFFGIFEFASPEYIVELANRMLAWFPEALEVPDRVTVFDIAGIQLQILGTWTVGMAGAVFLSCGVGAAAAWAHFWVKFNERRNRVAPSGAWRGFSTTLGVLPTPALLPRARIKFALPDDAPAFPPEHLALLHAILETLAAHPDAFVGDGHGVTLLEHTLNVMETTMESADSDSLAILAAAAHDLGKITAWVKKNDEWVRVKLHDRESMRLLAALPESFLLNEVDRLALTLAVGFDHRPDQMPSFSPETDQLAARLIKALRGADGAATREEKGRVLENVPAGELVKRSFLEALALLPLQVPGMTRGKDAAGWRKDGRLYLLEQRVRDYAIPLLPADVRAAYGDDRRERFKIAPFTLELLKSLHDAGWLVREVGNVKLPVSEALWKVKAGIVTFQGVFIVDIPEEYQERLPANTAYTLEVVEPQMMMPGMMSTTQFNVDSLFKQPGAKQATLKRQAPGTSSAKSAPIPPPPPVSATPVSATPVSAPVEMPSTGAEVPLPVEVGAEPMRPAQETASEGAPTAEAPLVSGKQEIAEPAASVPDTTEADTPTEPPPRKHPRMKGPPPPKLAPPPLPLPPQVPRKRRPASTTSPPK